MKKILLIICLLTQAALANELKNHVDNFIKTNQDIARFYDELNSADEESKNRINQELKPLKATKGLLLANFASLINKDNLSKKFFKELRASKSAYKDAELEFYGCLAKLSNAFINGEDIDIKEQIDASTEQIKAINDANANPANEAFIELLKYLKINSEIFKNSFVFKAIDAKSLIDQINSFFPQALLEYINIGKLVICVLIFGVVFFGLKKLVLKLLAAALKRALPSQERSANEHFFAKLRSPVIGLFLVYTLRLCAFVFFYPSPVAPLILKSLSVFNVVLISWMLITILNSYGLIFITKAASKSAKKDAINLMIKIANYIILVIAVLVALAFMGFDVSAIIASLGIGGLAVALAAKDIIANFFSSIMLHFDNSFSQGDWVQIGSVEGTVVEVSMRKTAIRTFDNSLVFVPNSQIMSSSIKNWSRRKLGRKIGLSIGLEYSTPASSVSKILEDIRYMLKNHPDIAQPSQDTYENIAKGKHAYRQSIVSLDDLDGYKNTLFVYLDEFAASSINIYVYCFSKSTVWGEFLRVKEDVMLKIMHIVQANGSGFAFPSQSVYLEQTPAAAQFAQLLKRDD